MYNINFMDLSFYKGKRVLVTGHTGFKGTWLSRILIEAGAVVAGYALEPKEEDLLFGLSKIEEDMTSYIGDIRDYDYLKKVFDEFEPEIVLHLAAQPLVKESYKEPRYTYDVNVMGTVNVCECVRLSKSVVSFVNVTTDKVYKNNEWLWGYREDEELDGYDPYSNSKSCSELVTNCYVKSFFNDMSVAVSTARAGNVIGGGDFAANRIIPDCIRAASKCEEIIVRNPNSTRPFQHVLEAVCAYLMIARAQYEEPSYQGNYNVGPNETDCITTGVLADMFCEAWQDGARWKNMSEVNAPHEANFLKLDCSRIKAVFGWKPVWTAKDAVIKTVEWAKVYYNSLEKVSDEECRDNIKTVMVKQIKEYLGV